MCFNCGGCHFFQLLSSSPIRIPSSRLHQIRRVSAAFKRISNNRMRNAYIILSSDISGVFPTEFF